MLISYFYVAKVRKQRCLSPLFLLSPAALLIFFLTLEKFSHIINKIRVFEKTFTQRLLQSHPGTPGETSGEPVLPGEIATATAEKSTFRRPSAEKLQATNGCKPVHRTCGSHQPGFATGFQNIY
jgi:hypothetical protein